MSDKGTNPERSLARMAARQHGVVSARQLADTGIDARAVAYRVKAGRLHRVLRGVYAVGHARITLEGRCLAAVLACGSGAVVSHRSAASLWGLLPASAGAVHVMLPAGGGHKRRKGLLVHRSRTLDQAQITRRAGVPVTLPSRTLADLRRTESGAVVQRVTRRALDLRLVSEDELGPDLDLTRSELERMFLRLCRRHRLPQPEVNAQVGPFEVDFLWRDAGLVVETDGFRHHGDRAAFERDRARDVELHTRGYRVLRFTYRQVLDSPAEVAEALRRSLRRGG